MRPRSSPPAALSIGGDILNTRKKNFNTAKWIHNGDWGLPADTGTQRGDRRPQRYTDGIPK